MTDTPAIHLKSLSKVYQRSHLGLVTRYVGLEHIDLTVRQGEVVGLLGLNGAGKTTTIKLVLGLLFPTTGKVEILGQPAGSHAAKAAIGYLPEIPYFYRYLTGREVLRFYGQLSGLEEKTLARRIEEVLGLVHMETRAQRPMREYSKGMLQRIGLAQSMLHDPAVYVFDEPVTGLDPLGLKEMREVISGLNQKGKTVFFSSHSISEVEKLCHRVVILVKGRLAKVLEQKDWTGHSGQLEEVFVETVTAGEKS